MILAIIEWAIAAGFVSLFLLVCFIPVGVLPWDRS